MKVGFVGLGKLGLPVALAVESKGHKVYGFDIKKEIYEQINKRKIDYKEKHANDLLKKTNIEIVDIKKLIGFTLNQNQIKKNILFLIMWLLN